jgi:hypothetical protein
MRSTTHCTRLLAIVVLLALADSAFANTIAPSAGFFPGFLPLALWMALPASVLAAFLERPFVARYGVAHDCLWYSLQANLVSLAVGYLTMPFALIAVYSIPPLWSVVAVSISIYCEGIYYQIFAPRRPGQWKRRWIVWGNIWSSLALLSIPVIAEALKKARPSLVWYVEPHHDTLLWGSVAASIVLFVAAWVVPAVKRRRRTELSKMLQQTAAASVVCPEIQPQPAATAPQLAVPAPVQLCHQLSPTTNG